MQPIRTSGGYPVYQGTPARLYVESNFSIQVLDSKGSVIYTLLEESIIGPGVFTSLTASGEVTFTGTGAVKLNAGTTAERPTPSNGMIRYNTSTSLLEAYIGGAWANVGSVTSVATGTGLTGGPITATGTIAIDSTVATLTGTQTLTNKTIEGGAITSGTAVASTSGTSIDFTSIPSWVKRITVMFNGVSTSGTSVVQIQIGSTTFSTSGYTSGSQVSTQTTATSGFIVENTGSGAAANTLIGAMTLSLFGSNTWVANGVMFLNSSNNSFNSGISPALSGVLDRVRITTVNGTDTFDLGSINILYEG